MYFPFGGISYTLPLLGFTFRFFCLFTHGQPHQDQSDPKKIFDSSIFQYALLHRQAMKQSSYILCKQLIYNCIQCTRQGPSDIKELGAGYKRVGLQIWKSFPRTICIARVWSEHFGSWTYHIALLDCHNSKDFEEYSYLYDLGDIFGYSTIKNHCRNNQVIQFDHCCYPSILALTDQVIFLCLVMQVVSDGKMTSVLTKAVSQTTQGRNSQRWHY